MAITLPARLEEAFSLLGVPWPTENEDRLQEYAGLLRSCGERLVADVLPDMQAALQILGVKNAGESVDELVSFMADYLYGKDEPAYLREIDTVLFALADTHDLASVIVLLIKWAFIVLATYVAAVLLWATIAAVYTGGVAAIKARILLVGFRATAQRMWVTFRNELERFFGKALVKGIEKRLGRVLAARAPNAARIGGAKLSAAAARRRGERLPGAPLERHRPLPKPEELRFEYGPDGLIVRVNGRSVEDFVDDLTLNRGADYMARRNEGTDLAFSAARSGPVLSVLLDRKTGKLYEGINDMIRVPDDFHPLLRERLTKLTNWSREMRPFNHGPKYPEPGNFPHFSEPGTHAEVTAVNKALLDRTARGETVTKETLQELYFDNRWLRKKDGVDLLRAPCCANCTHFLYDVPNPAKYYPTYPQPKVPVDSFTPPYS